MIAPALEALKVHRQFILYRLSLSQTRPGKTDKFPCDASSRVASAHDPANWMTATDAASLAQQFGDGYGVGFVLTPNTRRFCLDIDNCLQPDNTWSPLAHELCAMFPGAAIEISTSSRGLHIWGSYAGDMPAHSCKNVPLGIELYHEGRFIALGRPEGTTGDVDTDCTMAVHAAIALYFPLPAVQALAQEWTTAPCAEWRGPTDDDALIQRAMRSQSTASAFRGKAAFADLWAANAEALGRSYSDPVRPYDASSADAALAQHLAFWTGKDCERIRRIMERSALARDKWEREDYLPRTILGAVGRQFEVLTDKAVSALPPAMTVPSGTPDELMPDDFYAYLPTHSYINRRTREFLSVDAVNGHLRRFGDSLGMKPAAWLDMFQAVHQMSWQPSRPEIIDGMIADNGYLRPDPTGRIYNLYRPSDAVASDADASPWVEHVRRLYLEDAEHLIKWFAYRIQNPGEKINHALVIGGAQGIGKDLLLEPLRYGVGESNFADINPGDLFKDFTGWVESTLIIINEARDLGDVDRYKFYEHAKRFIAAPPDTLPCNRKYLAAYNVPNVMGVVITSNNKLSGLYIDPDDRRHYVAWSNAEKQPAAYFDALWAWMEGGGKNAVIGYLQRLDLADFNPKAPPPKTEAWHQIVAAHVNPDETALSEAVEDAQGNRIQIATVREIIAAAQFRGDLGLATTLQDKRNARKIPQMLERIGFEVLRNPYAKSDGRWRLSDGRKDTLYVDRSLPYAEQIALANSRSKDLH
jgi:hypothetical protein